MATPMGRSRVERLRSASRILTDLIAGDVARPPSDEISARHHAEWPQLWERLDELHAIHLELRELTTTAYLRATTAAGDADAQRPPPAAP